MSTLYLSQEVAANLCTITNPRAKPVAPIVYPVDNSMSHIKRISIFFQGEEFLLRQYVSLENYRKI